MIATMVAFKLAFAFITADWFLYWMLAWFNVLNLLNNLEFRGGASLSQVFSKLLSMQLILGDCTWIKLRKKSGYIISYKKINFIKGGLKRAVATFKLLLPVWINLKHDAYFR